MRTIRAVDSGRWMPTAISALLVALLCGLLMYWTMQLIAPQVTIAPSGSLVNAEAAIDTSSARTLFGSASGQVAPVQRRASVKVEVFGIAASEQRAAAILGIDGKPAGVYAVGQPIDGDDEFSITTISASEVVLDRDGEIIRVPVPSGGDLAVLTSGRNSTSSLNAPVSTNPARQTRRNARNRGRSGGARPSLQPRRLPPSGAAAAAAAARNTTGIAQGNTPAAGRPAGVGRPRQDNQANPNINKTQPNRTRVGTPARVTAPNSSATQ